MCWPGRMTLVTQPGSNSLCSPGAPSSWVTSTPMASPPTSPVVRLPLPDTIPRAPLLCSQSVMPLHLCIPTYLCNPNCPSDLLYGLQLFCPSTRYPSYGLPALAHAVPCLICFISFSAIVLPFSILVQSLLCPSGKFPERRKKEAGRKVYNLFQPHRFS